MRVLAQDVRARKYGKDESRSARPAMRQRTRENVDLARQSEQRLDSLWANFDQVLRKYGLAPFAPDARLLETIQRTPPWNDSELSKTSARAPLPLAQNLTLAEDLKAWYRDLQVNNERTLEGAQTTAPAKIKLKTRGVGVGHRSVGIQTS
ncbi:uncharacterized protein K489DRAFT_383503 [Dissoconium aciculare CBS 342.82]|uniref:Uncharacterized protein n=1 Tax=Dissoconium aciculare CBS 342.82 TaxID=1314786 RepID=A0A6J3LWB0_9PEZI|nr:uncharacterized protein K489DRAFT_383503 [Dissoconium aciculare CBS 342.82]KAF1819948.1 hypothetical protein K489DRAFT_383503 [Dissoconium aciculare CBS 342.82]